MKEQVYRLQAALQQALAQRAELQDRLEQNEKTILALKNTLQGVELGRQMAAEESKPEDPEAPTE